MGQHCLSAGSVAGRSDDVEGVVRDDAARKKAIDSEAEKIKDIDKMTFTLSAFNIGMTCYWFGRWPESFYLWHIPKVLVLTGVRWYLFKGEGKHYLLYDFCYWANGLSIYYTLFRPMGLHPLPTAPVPSLSSPLHRPVIPCHAPTYP